MSLRSLATGARSRARTLPERHGGPVVIGLLCAIVALGFGLRLDAALNPKENPGADSIVAYQGNDSLAYGQIAADALPDGAVRHARDGAPDRLVARRAALVRGRLLPDGRRAPGRGALGGRDARRAHGAARLPDRPPARRPGRRPRRRALLAAIYPTFIDNNEQFVSASRSPHSLCPPVLGLLWASDRARSVWAWLVPGLFLGATALTRPEYLIFAFLFGLLVLVTDVARPRRAARRRRGGAVRRARSRSCSRPGRSATSSCSTASCRSRPAAARRSSSRPTCRATAASSAPSAS